MNNQAKPRPTAALMVIGDEILSGRTHDTNTHWIAGRLTALGIALSEVRVVPDVEGEIIDALNALRHKYDSVFTTGGIGPTHDDITAEAVAKAFGVALEVNETAYQALVKYYGDEAEITPPRRKMAIVPVGANLIDNPVSGAPGFQMDNVYVMAGVPRIMQAMFDGIAGGLQGADPVQMRTMSCVVGESRIAQPLTDLQAKYPDVAMGSYPNYREGQQSVALVLRSADATRLDAAVQELDVILTQMGVEHRLLDQ